MSLEAHLPFEHNIEGSAGGSEVSSGREIVVLVAARQNGHTFGSLIAFTNNVRPSLDDPHCGSDSDCHVHSHPRKARQGIVVALRVLF